MATPPDVIRARRQETIDAPHDPEQASRVNSLDVLAGLGPDADTASWLLPLLSDDIDVLHRHVVTPLPPSKFRKRSRSCNRGSEHSDELEAEADGRALAWKRQ